jgi:hypothetical protein
MALYKITDPLINRPANCVIAKQNKDHTVILLHENDFI